MPTQSRIYSDPGKGKIIHYCMSPAAHTNHAWNGSTESCLNE